MSLKSIFIRTFAAFAIFLASLLIFPATTSAINCNDPSLSAQQAIQCGANGGAGQNSANQSVDQASKKASTSLGETIANVLDVLSLIVGITAVVMIIVGGLRYVASAGKQESVSAAKSTISYAIVGLIVVAFAQAIVHFVLRNVTDKP